MSVLLPCDLLRLFICAKFRLRIFLLSIHTKTCFKYVNVQKACISSTLRASPVIFFVGGWGGHQDTSVFPIVCTDSFQTGVGGGNG